jgi:hypothetical protein
MNAKVDRLEKKLLEQATGIASILSILQQGNNNIPQAAAAAAAVPAAQQPRQGGMCVIFYLFSIFNI